MRLLLISTLLLSSLCLQQVMAGESVKDAIVLDFEDVPIDQLPEGWKVTATNQKGPQATWKVIEDKTAPSGKKVLAMLSPNHDSEVTFNICWTDFVLFRDGEIEISFKAIKGEKDQGGGPIWRYQDHNNYYIARANPLENNFRVYKVVNGNRKQLASANVEITSGKWHTIKIISMQDKIQLFYDGKFYLEVKDTAFEQGSIGLWTKADAITAFDDIKLKLLP